LNPSSKIRGAALLLLIFFGCKTLPAPAASERIAISDGWLAMGTFFEADLRVRPDQAGLARNWLEWARVEIVRLEKIYSRHDPDSEISALNRKLARDEVVRTGARLDPELESIFFSAIEVWEGSGGAFDITVGPFVDVWNDEVPGKLPSVERLRRVKRHVGSEALLMLGEGNLGLTTGGMRIDLDGISKGAVLDHLRERLETDLPGAAVLLSFGQSSVLALGDPEGGDGWQLVVRSRDPSNGDLAIVRLRNRALSVSSSVGSVENIAGARVSHIIDPRTGSARSETVEAIVVADRAAIADGWSTALVVTGATPAVLGLVEKAGVEANVSESSGRSVMSRGWRNELSVFPAHR
jgi:thiamine biosynthesis lipoprotein